MTRVLEPRGRLLRDRVDPAMHVGVGRLVVLLHGVEHRVGLLRGGRRVEVHEPLAVHHLVEDREVLLDHRGVDAGHAAALLKDS